MNYKTITREELQVGDEVQIANGDWYEISSLADELMELYADRYFLSHKFYSTEKIITGFRRQVEEQKSEKWLIKSPVVYNVKLLQEVYNEARKDAEEELKEIYGSPPIVRTYNGEPAEQFGLKLKQKVLMYREHGYWGDMPYGCMSKGDKWMKQPKQPKE